MIAHLQDGEYHGKRILKAETARQMHDSPLTTLPPLNRMELGFFETNINGREVIGHLGDTDYFHTSLHLFLKESVGFYVSFNSPGKDGAVQGLRTALFKDFADRYFPAAPQAGVDAKTAAQHAAMLQGSWVNSRESQSNFLAGDRPHRPDQGRRRRKGRAGGAAFPGLNGKPRHWIEIEPFVWRDLDDHDRLAAKVVDGKPVRFSIDLLSPFMVFERVPWYAEQRWLVPAAGRGRRRAAADRAVLAGDRARAPPLRRDPGSAPAGPARLSLSKLAALASQRGPGPVGLDRDGHAQGQHQADGRVRRRSGLRAGVRHARVPRRRGRAGLECLGGVERQAALAGEVLEHRAPGLGPAHRVGWRIGKLLSLNLNY